MVTAGADDVDGWRRVARRVSGTSAARASTASSSPASSAALSPLARSATTKPISWAGVASPDRIVVIADSACVGGEVIPVEQQREQRGPSAVFVDRRHVGRG